MRLREKSKEEEAQSQHKGTSMQNLSHEVLQLISQMLTVLFSDTALLMEIVLPLVEVYIQTIADYLSQLQTFIKTLPNCMEEVSHQNCPGCALKEKLIIFLMSL